jgi:uncharacterized protein (TIGR03086 family)
MTTTDHSVALLSRALDQTGDIIAAIKPDQAHLPTPCNSWDVEALVTHVVDEVQRLAEMAETGKRGSGDGAPLGDDWSGAYRAAADSLKAAWASSGALDRMHELPGVEVPASWAVGQHITEVVIHGWDIAKATGQSTDDLDPEVGEAAFDWGKANLIPEFRGHEADGAMIGHEVQVGPDAPLYTRLAAFGGRQP